MEAVRRELDRIGRAYARIVGGRRAARLHLVLLVVAVCAAFVHRIGLTLPGLDLLAGRWLPTLACAAALLALGPLLLRPVTRLLRPRPETLARRLDDSHHWRDETSTVLGMTAPELDRPLPALLEAQAVGRLRTVQVRPAGPAKPPWAWPRYLLAFLFAFILLAPGALGLFRQMGPEPLADTGGGETEALEPAGPPRPMRADFWLQCFVENPLPVEPLPEPSEEPGDGER